MLLQHLLKKENNNLDIFRIVAACMVIYGHAFAIVPAAGSMDMVYKMIRFDYSGSLAVKIFFFLSGLVVTNSLIEKNRPTQFLVARFFRIWPALLVTLLVSALILGPLTSDLHYSKYFGLREVYSYVWDGLIMKMQFKLPGVFTQSHYPNIVNGSLWTIPYEVAAYLVLLSLSMTRLLQARRLAILLFLFILADPLQENRMLFSWLPRNHEVDLLAPCFAFGSLLAMYKDRIHIDGQLATGAWIMFYLFRHHAFNFYFLYFALFISILYISSQKYLVKIKFRADISYGIYLWGFPVQQTIASLYAGQSLLANQLSSIAVTALLGWISWHGVEKRCIALGARLGRRPSSTTLHSSREPVHDLTAEA